MVQKSTGLLNRFEFDADYLTRLRAGDQETAKHFDSYFRRRLQVRVGGKFSWEREAELVQDIIAAALSKILRGEPRNAGCLAAYVFGICSNLI